MIIKEVDDLEMPWHKKVDDIFWRGATTGGGSNPPGYLPLYQRHRYVSLSDAIPAFSYSSTLLQVH
jgi:hypothetical protein